MPSNIEKLLLEELPYAVIVDGTLVPSAIRGITECKRFEQELQLRAPRKAGNHG